MQVITLTIEIGNQNTWPQTDANTKRTKSNQETNNETSEQPKGEKHIKKHTRRAKTNGQVARTQ